MGEKDSEEKKEEESKESEKDSEEKKEDESKESEKDSEEKKEDESEEKKKETEEKKKRKKKKAKKKKPKLYKLPLHFKIVHESDPALGPLHMSKENFKKSHALIDALDVADKERIERETTMNSLESMIYAARDLVRDEDHGAFEVTTEETRAKIIDDLEVAEEWTYDEGAEASLADVRSKMNEVKLMIDKIKGRISEKTARPLAVKALQGALAATSIHLAKWTEKLKPQISEEEREEVSSMADEIS